ncbi:transcription elongation protein SprT [Ornithobacterium rhinotracheale]|uniref:SprT-like domain-containing protein n=1 Tax=Ornithobacterium rhinotracheale TaxID=28251 RepID=UPI00129CA483|nr:SprT-like domain-containing protein [Ornithobacterium rhinotracheale]MRJ09552.1 transcription elongation protein SprT [Ornithobacterium rhinotracheale]
MPVQGLKKFIPEASLPHIAQWISGYPLLLKVKNNRKSKLGDYRKIPRGHQITINRDLSPYLFLITLTHEIAHMHTFDKFGFRISPHGKEWKSTFATLLQETLHLYPEDLQPIMTEYIQNPKANFYAFSPFVAYFSQEEKQEDTIFLKDLPKGTIFALNNKIFKKGEIKRIRYICREISTGKSYLIHELAPVKEYRKIN